MTIVFIPIGIMLARSMGYDAMVRFAMVSVGAQVGFQSGWMNPFTVGVAQGIAELPLFSGIVFRLIIWVIFMTELHGISYVTQKKSKSTRV